MKTYDIALIEKPHDEGITLQDVAKLYSLITGQENSEEEMIPLDIEGESSAAMGFISMEAAESMDYDFGPLKRNVCAILNDTAMETPDRRYEYTHGNMAYKMAIMI